MKKLLLAILIGTIFSSSCKKANETTFENKNNGILNKEIDPIPLDPPSAYFVINNILWRVSNLTSNNPTVENKGELINVYTFGPVKQNVFNTNSFLYSKQAPIYNPYTGKMIVINPFAGKTLNQCHLSTLTNTFIDLPNKPKPGIALKVGPNQKIYYYSERENNDIIIRELRNINENGTNDIPIINYNINQNAIPPINGGDINFDDNLLYSPSNDGHIYVTELNNMGKSKIFVPGIFGESFKNAVVKYSSKHGLIFFTSVIKSSGKRRLYSLHKSGDLTTIKKLLEVNYIEENDNGNGTQTFTFDILSDIDAIVWGKREWILNTDKHMTNLYKMDMQGNNSKLLFSREAYMNTIIAANPVTYY